MRKLSIAVRSGDPDESAPLTYVIMDSSEEKPICLKAGMISDFDEFTAELDTVISGIMDEEDT